MNHILSVLGDFDGICGQIALAMQHAQFQIYGTLVVVILLSALLFPPKNDPDQI